MKKIALEGPINGCNDNECINWRNEVISKLKDKYTFHNPMDFDCRGKEEELRKELISIDTIGITSSDIVLVMADKQTGWGTAMGVQMAWAMHKTIYTVYNSEKSPSPWLVDRSTIMFRNLDDAIRFLLQENELEIGLAAFPN